MIQDGGSLSVKKQSTLNPFNLPENDFTQNMKHTQKRI